MVAFGVADKTPEKPKGSMWVFRYYSFCLVDSCRRARAHWMLEEQCGWFEIP